MRFGKIMIGLLTAVFLTTAVVLGVMEYGQVQAVSLSAAVAGTEGTEQVRGWQAESGAFYLFLPSYASLSGTTLQVTGVEDARLEGTSIGSGLPAQALSPGRPYGLSYREKGQLRETTLTLLCSGNMPTLYLDTRSGSLDYIRSARGNRESGSLRLYSPEGIGEAYEVKSVNVRGNATFAEDKTPLGLTLAAEADLLGMGAAEKWVLLANAYDASNLKNKIVLDFAAAFGLNYTPSCQWVDVYFNGEYAGLYLLAEKIEVHPQRVALNKDTAFLVSKEQTFNLEKKSEPYVKLESDYAVRIHHTAYDTQTLTEVLQSVENALLAPDGYDPVTGKHWQELIDLDSWARKYLLEEVFANPDAGFGSQFFYSDPALGTGKLYAGPAWDYDNAMQGVPVRGIVHRPCLWPGEEALWMVRLLEQEEFSRYTIQLYQQEFLPLLETLLEEGLDRYERQILPAAAVNQVRWSGEDQEEQTKGLRRYLKQRADFLWKLWVEEEDFCWVSMYYPNAPSQVYACYPGEPYRNPTYEDKERSLGWYDPEAGEYVDISQNVTGDIVLYLQYPEEPEQTFAQWLRASAHWLVPFGVLLVVLVLLILRDIDLRKRERRSGHGRKARIKISP